MHPTASAAAATNLANMQRRPSRKGKAKTLSGDSNSTSPDHKRDTSILRQSLGEKTYEGERYMGGLGGVASGKGVGEKKEKNERRTGYQATAQSATLKYMRIRVTILSNMPTEIEMHSRI